MSEVVRPDRLRGAVGHTIKRLDVRAPQMDVDLVILCGDNTGARVATAVGLPAVLPLRRLAENGLTGDLRRLRRTRPDRYNLNGGAVVVGRHGAR